MFTQPRRAGGWFCMTERERLLCLLLLWSIGVDDDTSLWVTIAPQKRRIIRTIVRGPFRVLPEVTRHDGRVPQYSRHVDTKLSGAQLPIY
jgi:hypothetical protein